MFKHHICIAFLMSLMGCAHSTLMTDQSANESAIREASHAFSAAYVSNDAEALGKVYSADAVLLPPTGEVRGRKDIQKYFAWGPKFRQIEHAMESTALDIRGSIAIDIGTWRSTSQTGSKAHKSSSGSYLVVWVREKDGNWRIKYDAWHRPPEAN